jgi:hypothetical protein
MKTFKGLLKELPYNGVFVFLSDIQGKHEKGPARIAHELFGAEKGKAFHTMGRSYGICIKFTTQPRVEESFMKNQINILYTIAKNRDKDKLFYIMYNGATIGNYTGEELGKIFRHIPIPDNILFEETFANIMQGRVKPKTIDDEI